MSSPMKDARWMRAIDVAASTGEDWYALSYPEKAVRLNLAQVYLDKNPDKVQELAERFSNTDPESEPWVEETPTAFTIRLAKAAGIREALLYAKVRIHDDAPAQELSSLIDEYIADLERPKNRPSRIHLKAT